MQTCLPPTASQATSESMSPPSPPSASNPSSSLADTASTSQPNTSPLIPARTALSVNSLVVNSPTTLANLLLPSSFVLSLNDGGSLTMTNAQLGGQLSLDLGTYEEGAVFLTCEDCEGQFSEIVLNGVSCQSVEVGEQPSSSQGNVTVRTWAVLFVGTGTCSQAARGCSLAWCQA